MTRAGVNRFLLIYLVVIWAAVVFRIDRFPFTWAPMYSTVSARGPIIARRIVDREEMKKGLVVTYRDGSEGRLNQDDLNIPKWNFYRLYYQRAFLGDPPKYLQLVSNLGALNRFVRGIEPGQSTRDAIPEKDWERRLFYSLNKTQGALPGDPRFIVRVRAHVEYAHFLRDPLRFSGRETRESDLHWRDAWSGDFDAGLP